MGQKLDALALSRSRINLAPNSRHGYEGILPHKSVTERLVYTRSGKDCGLCESGGFRLRGLQRASAMIDSLTQLRVRGHALWRRRWIALATAWALMLLGSTVVLLLPDQYQAAARVYVDTDFLMGPLLKGIAVEDDPTQQLAIMESTLLSRPNLTEVARAVFPAMDASNEVEVEGAMDSLKARTVVEVSGKKLFRIAHVEFDPRLAKDVVQSFLNIFVEGNLGQDRSDMENAQSFIAKQLALYEKQLQEIEKRRADFQAKNADVISPSKGSFSQQLEKARADVEQATAELAQAKDRGLPATRPKQSSANQSKRVFSRRVFRGRGN